MTFQAEAGASVERACALGFDVEVRGITVLLRLSQPQFGADGRFLGVAGITIEARRSFGGSIDFAKPPKVTLTNAAPGETPTLVGIGLLAVKVLTDPAESLPRAARVAAAAPDPDRPAGGVANGGTGARRGAPGRPPGAP